jgi:hypothetical protein
MSEIRSAKLEIGNTKIETRNATRNGSEGENLVEADPSLRSGCVDKALVWGVWRLLWVNSPIRRAAFGEANDAFGNNAA